MNASKPNTSEGVESGGAGARGPRRRGSAGAELRRRAPAGLVALLAVLVALGCAADAPRADAAADAAYLLRGGTVVDGSGEPGFEADVLIRGDRIARVATEGIPEEDAAGAAVLDASGLVIAPGFVDHHAHIQTSIHRYPLAENFVRQGITTIVASLHSGSQPWPLDEYTASLEVAPNVGFFAGHSFVRRRVLGLENRAPTADELDAMRALVDESMRAGALGLSTGLLYVPANYAEIDEVIELARVAARHGGIYVSHLRDEGMGLVDGVRELIRIADEAGLPAQINHHKARAVANWGASEQSLVLIDSARAEGLDIKHDLYPYTASSTGSSVLFPQWALAGGRDSLAARLREPTTRARIEAEMAEIIGTVWAGDDLSRIQFRSLPSHSEYDGRTMADLVRARGLPNDVQTGVRTAIELQLEGGFSAIYHAMDEADVIRIMQHPYAMFETDGDPVGYDRGFPHPRSYGAFPRVLGHYVRELGVLDLEEAVRRMTSLSQRQLGQHERGLVQEGMLADITVFDPDRIRDNATFTDPHRYPSGIVHVIINGVPVIRNGALTGEKPGRVLKGPARSEIVAADG